MEERSEHGKFTTGLHSPALGPRDEFALRNKTGSFGIERKGKKLGKQRGARAKEKLMEKVPKRTEVKLTHPIPNSY